MFSNYLTKLKELPFLNLIEDKDGIVASTLKILGGLSLTAVGCWVGYAIYGLMGAAFGLIFGYVAGKLIIK